MHGGCGLSADTEPTFNKFSFAKLKFDKNLKSKTNKASINNNNSK